MAWITNNKLAQAFSETFENISSQMGSFSTLIILGSLNREQYDLVRSTRISHKVLVTEWGKTLFGQTKFIRGDLFCETEDRAVRGWKYVCVHYMKQAVKMEHKS